MTTEDKNTEEKIMEAARQVFIQKGMAASRMQEIADTAGINKALLHYYYRSKEKLFLAVFKYAFSQFIPRIEKSINAEKTFEGKISLFVENYISILIKHPYIPLFIMQEINRNPETLYKVIVDSGISPQNFFTYVENEVKAGHIRPIDPKSLIINMLSLCIFPIAAKPLLQRVFFNNDNKTYNTYLKSRAKEVIALIINLTKIVPETPEKKS